MNRYIVKLLNTKHSLVTLSDKDNHLVRNERYIQLLGFTKGNWQRTNSISFWELDDVDLDSLKNYKPVLLKRNGVPKILTSLVEQVKREKI